MKRRIFIAINLPENIKNKLIVYQRKWGDLPVRWAPKLNLHITLVFIGYVGDDEMYEICNIVRETAKRHEPFIINLKKIILGPPNKFPRMFWVEGERNEEIAKLKSDLEDMLLKSDNSGFRKKEAFSFPVESIEVMQSNLKRTGAEYAVLESVELG